MIKKRSKVLISFLFALIFVFQLAVPMAGAVNDPVGPTLSAKYSAELTAEQVQQQDNLEELPQSGEVREINFESGIAGLEAFSVKFDDSVFSAPVTVTGSEVIAITVPADYYISKLYMHDSAQPADVTENLLTLASVDPETGDIILDTKDLYIDGKFDYSLAGTDESVNDFTLEVELARIDSEESVTVKIGNEPEFEAMGDMTAPEAPELAANETFIDWTLTYKNGLKMSLNPGDRIPAYISCVLTPNIEVAEVPAPEEHYMINVTVNDLTVNLGDELNFNYTVGELPEGLSLTDVSYALSKDGNAVANDSIAAGESYAISMSFNVALNGENLSENKVSKVVTDGTLTVNAATPVEKLNVTVTPNAPKLNDEKTDFVADQAFDVQGLEKGFTLEPANGSFTYTVQHKNNADNTDCVYTVITGEYVIKDANGNAVADAADKYNVVFAESALVPYVIPAPPVAKINLSIKPANVNVEYNGQDQTASNWEYLADSEKLKDGDVLTAQFSGSANAVTSKAVESEITGFTITRDGKDVSAEYNVTTLKGEINVMPRNITITAFSGDVNQTAENQEIFAKDQNTNGFTNGYKVDGLLENHVISGVQVTGSGKTGGAVKTSIGGNTVTISVKDSNPAEDVTANYKITSVDGSMNIIAYTAPAVNRGELTIKPKDIVVEYDGKEHKPAEYELTGTLAEGDTIEVTFSGASTNVCTNLTTEIASVVIKDKDGNDVTLKYSKITKNPGLLTIKSHTLTLTGITATIQQKTEGETINANAYGYKDGSFKNGLKVEGLLEGHKLSGVKVTGSSNTPGDFASKVDISGLKLTDANNNDIKANYNIVTNDGKITVKAPENSKPTEKEIPLTITAKDAKWTYDGNAHECKEYSVSGLKDGDKVKSVTFDNSSTITNAGTVANKISNVVIVDKDGKAISDAKYKKTFKDGTLTVDKYNLTVTAESASKNYDGKPLENKNVSIGKLANSQHKIQVVYTIYNSNGKTLQNPPIDAGTYTKKITKLSIFDANKQDVTDNYNIKKVDGTLTIKNSDKNNTSGPKTGDESHLGIWIGILAASAVLVIAVVVVVIMKNKKAAEVSDAEASLDASDEESGNEFEINIDDFKDSDSSDNSDDNK